MISSKAIMITGSGGVLGKKFINKLLLEGHKIYASELNTKKVKELKSIFGNNQNFDCYVCDVSSETSVIKWFDRVFKLSKIDTVINNASITSELLRDKNEAPNSFEDTSVKSWNMTLNVSLTGSFLVAREFGRYLKNTNNNDVKKLINISSMYALNGPDHSIYEGTNIKSFAAYSSSKAGIVGLTKWLASYWGSKGITVNALAPGGVYNNHEKKFKDRLERKIPLGRMASADDIANALAFMVSDQSDYMNGHVLYVDGGYTSI